MFINTA